MLGENADNPTFFKRRWNQAAKLDELINIFGPSASEKKINKLFLNLQRFDVLIMMVMLFSFNLYQAL